MIRQIVLTKFKPDTGEDKIAEIYAELAKQDRLNGSALRSEPTSDGFTQMTALPRQAAVRQGAN